MDSGVAISGWVSLVLGWGLITALALFCFKRVLSHRGRGPGAGQVDGWASRTGLILAMAGNAVGLGNFLRFPVKAAANGGGAFLIPYFVALLLLGVPLMWVEWTMGRYGGNRGHRSTPGMMALMWKHPLAKYLGAFGLFLPFLIGIYYVFIESWTLGYAFFSATGSYLGQTSRETMKHFLLGYQGVESNEHFGSVLPAALFLLATISINYFFLRRGIARGIELLAKIGMPTLFAFAVVLAVRVLTLGTPDPTHPDFNVGVGLGFMWNADFSQLGQASVWLVAAGQIFFTLSLGQGMINTYAAYVSEKEDVALNGLSTASVNEFAEVILGGTIAIPVAVAFFGLTETQQIARQGAFDLGFISLPVIFQQLPLGQLFSVIWFTLLFIAGITSSVAMMQPTLAFLKDEFGWSHRKACDVAFSVLLCGTVLVIAFFKHGFLDELDFWAGTLGLALFAVIEIVIFGWVFGIDRGFEELDRGADLRVPRIFKLVIKYVTPCYLIAILATWTAQEAISKFLMEGEDPGRRPYLWGARGLLLAVVLLTLFMVRKAWRQKHARPGQAEVVGAC